MSEIRKLPDQSPTLRDYAECGGCAAKAPPDMIAMITGLVAGAVDENVITGLKPFDDAAIYKLDEQRALVASVDFFPPLLDDPYDYGRVAATNAVSDIYAMGGELAFALTISGFPADVPANDIATVNVAASDVVRECGGQILGGHSIRCKEPVFGLCVLGFADLANVWRKAGAKAGNVLMLSKAVGTGVLLSEHSKAGVKTATESMCISNRAAANALHACTTQPLAVTDVTGYGLLGHAAEVAERSGVALLIEARNVPLLAGAYNAAQRGTRTSADSILMKNENVRLAANLDPALRQLLFDPQTSGGLLAAVDASAVAELQSAGFHVIGQIEAGPTGRVLVA